MKFADFNVVIPLISIGQKSLLLKDGIIIIILGRYFGSGA